MSVTPGDLVFHTGRGLARALFVVMTYLSLEVLFVLFDELLVPGKGFY